MGVHLPKQVTVTIDDIVMDLPFEIELDYQKSKAEDPEITDLNLPKSIEKEYNIIKIKKGE